MELIDRAIKKIENEFAEVLTSHGYDSYEKADLFYQWYCDGLMKAIGILLDMEAEETRWIPCSERLPEAGQIVLVSNKYGHVWIFKRIESGWSAPDEGWFMDEEEPDRVKAWMPLPKPYEERREEE